MQLRPLAEGDLEFVRLLRNANRRFFFTDAEISSEQQRRWFATLPAKPIDFYIIENDGAAVGTISATRADGWVEIGNLLLNPDARGQGLMRRAVEELTAQPGRYFSAVKTDNTKSRAVFEATGFTVAATGDVVRYEKIIGGASGA